MVLNQNLLQNLYRLRHECCRKTKYLFTVFSGDLSNVAPREYALVGEINRDNQIYKNKTYVIHKKIQERRIFDQKLNSKVI